MQRRSRTQSSQQDGTVEILFMPQALEWYQGLVHAQQRKVAAVLDFFSQRGLTVKEPYVKSLIGHEKIRELRISMGSARGSREHRGLFSYFRLRDKGLHALVHVAGDKTGNWVRWYKENVPVAEAVFKAFEAGEGNSPPGSSLPVTAARQTQSPKQKDEGVLPPRLYLKDVIRWGDVSSGSPAVPASTNAVAAKPSGRGR